MQCIIPGTYMCPSPSPISPASITWARPLHIGYPHATPGLSVSPLNNIASTCKFSRRRNYYQGGKNKGTVDKAVGNVNCFGIYKANAV